MKVVKAYSSKGFSGKSKKRFFSGSQSSKNNNTAFFNSNHAQINRSLDNTIQRQESGQTNSDLASVKIWFKAFIPGNISGYTKAVPAGTHSGKTMIPGPTPLNDCFLTDNRSWDNSILAKSRLNSVIDLNLSKTAPTINNESHWCDATSELDCEDGAVECSRYGDSSSMNFYNLRKNSTGQVLINLIGHANNPCFIGSPAIDYFGVIMIDPVRRIVAFNGKVDEFPDFEMYINGREIIREPHPAGNTPGNLFGGANRSVFGLTFF